MKRVLCVCLALSSLTPLWGQTTGTLTQTVQKRGTIVTLGSSSLSNVSVGSSVTYNAVLTTAGAPVVISEDITFTDGANALGSVPLTVVNTTNLLPFSVGFNNWTTVATGGATAPTLTPLSTASPDGTTEDPATILTFPATTAGQTSGLSLGVTGTAFAGQTLTASVYLQATTATTVTLGITDFPAQSANGTQTCNVGTTWTRCTFTFPMPANAGTGFALSIVESGAAAQAIDVWGAQVEQAATAGPYIETLGTSLSGQGAAVTFSSVVMTDGPHTITASYAGDNNFIGSNATLSFNAQIGASTTVLTESSPTGSVGQPVTFSATVSNTGSTPTGTVTFMDGATAIGTGTLSNGVATFTTSVLNAGTHTITAVYGGNTEVTGSTSTPVTYTVASMSATASIAVTSTLNPSIYGESVTITATLTGIGGVVPTGSVTILDGTTNLGTFPLTVGSTTSVATTTLSTFTAGTHNLTVNYSGDQNFLP
jgi:hypothetical protein